MTAPTVDLAFVRQKLVNAVDLDYVCGYRVEREVARVLLAALDVVEAVLAQDKALDAQGAAAFALDDSDPRHEPVDAAVGDAADRLDAALIHWGEVTS